MMRLYREEDLPRVMEIANAAWQEIYKMRRECYGDELFSILVPDPGCGKGDEVREYISMYPGWAFVCEEEGTLVGFVTFRLDHEKKIGEIMNNAVDPKCNLKGMGQQMYKAVLQRFRDEGMRYAHVWTGLDYAHAPARRAYERAGFNIRREDVRYYMKL